MNIEIARLRGYAEVGALQVMAASCANFEVSCACVALGVGR